MSGLPSAHFLAGFDIPKALGAFEDELNSYYHPGFKFSVDRYNYSQCIGSDSSVKFKVVIHLDLSTESTPSDMVKNFYEGVSAFLDNDRFDAYANLSIEERANGPIYLVADVTVPMTFKDFGDQI